jgi:hypothetical protein
MEIDDYDDYNIFGAYQRPKDFALVYALLQVETNWAFAYLCRVCKRKQCFLMGRNAAERQLALVGTRTEIVRLVDEYRNLVHSCILRKRNAFMNNFVIERDYNICFDRKKRRFRF